MPQRFQQGRTRREGNSEAAPEAVGQVVGGGCQSGWGRVLSVTNAIDAGTWRQADSGWTSAGRPGGRGGGGYLPPFQCIPGSQRSWVPQRLCTTQASLQLRRSCLPHALCTVQLS